MKALLVADNALVIEHVSMVLKAAGYDMITYHALLKALDNIEEIAPHLIVISTKEYPRHWKTLAQYATTPLGSYTPQVILYTGGAFTEEDEKKAAALHVRGWFHTVDVDGLDDLRAILAEKDDIFSGELTDAAAEANAPRPIEIPDDFAKKHAHDAQMLSEFVEEEVNNPGVSLEKIGLEMENEMTRAASPMEAAAVTDEELEESDDQLEEVVEITSVDDNALEGALSETVTEEQPHDDEPEEPATISVDDILKQNQSFNRFADIPDIVSEDEAKNGGVHEFGDIKGRREDAGDIGKSPMDLWAEIEAEEGGVFDDEPEPEPNFNPISISLEELSNLKHVEPEETDQSEAVVDDEPQDEATVSDDDRLAEIDKLAEADEQEAGINFRPIAESLAALAEENEEPPVVAEASEPEEKPMSISLEELLAAQKAAEGDRARQQEMHTSVKEKIQKVAEGAQHIAQDPEHPVTVTQREVDEVQERNQVLTNEGVVDGETLAVDVAETETTAVPETTSAEPILADIMTQNQATDTQLAWLANENADEPEHPDTEHLDTIADPTGSSAHEVASSLGDILQQNQTTDAELSWLAEENADEPEHPLDIDDDPEPTGRAAADVDNSLGEILQQNQSMDKKLDWLSEESADEPEHPLDLDDNAEPTGRAAADVDNSLGEILQQNQTTDTELDWLANENADEPEHPLDIDDDPEPTGRAAAEIDNEVASSVQDILTQNQIMDRQLAWLSDENADEPEAPEDAYFDDNTEPTGISASERDANIQDILSQNQITNTAFQADMDELQRLVDKLNILRSIVCTVLITNPDSGVLISGDARNFNRNTLEFTPDISEFTRNFTVGMKLPQISIKTENGIESASATIVSAGEQYLISIDHDE